MKSSKTITVATNEAALRKLVEKVLKREGYRTLTAKSAQEALEILKSRKVDILVADAKMSGQSGLELLKAVKRERPELAVIIMTGYGDTYAIKEALLLGADEYIAKPFKESDIQMIVERTYWRILASNDVTASKTR